MQRIILRFILISLVLSVNSLTNNSYGQLLNGKVTDEKGDPLPGATISINNSFLGTHTRSDGTYTIKLPANGSFTVKISFIGYAAAYNEINIFGSLTLNTQLIPAEIMAKEIIVNGIRAGLTTPVTYTNIGSDLIGKGNSGQDIPFLIGLTPSLVETSETGTGIGYTGMRIRGTDGSRINVTIDGIPLNDAESQQVFWVDLPDLASSVENIQVQRGVGTSTNGSGAFGASLNIETKNPEDKPFADASSSYGSYNTFRNTITAGTGLLSGKFALQMRLSDIKSDGYIERTGSDNRSAYLSGLYVSGRSRLKANIILGEEHSQISWWGVPQEMLSLNRRYNPAGEYTDETGARHFYDNESDNYWQNHFQLIYSLEINKFLFFHSAFHYTRGTGYYEEYREDQNFEDYGLTSFFIGNNEIVSTDLIRRKWMANDFFGGVWSLTYKKGRTEAVLGGGVNSYDGKHYGRIIWMRNAGNTETNYQWYLNKALKDEVNIYGKLNFGFTEELHGFIDLDYRHIYYKMKGPDDDLRVLAEKHSYDFFNPKTGLFYSLASNQEAFFSIAVAHKEPTRSDYQQAAGDATVTPVPESLYDAEMGYNLRNVKTNLGINLYTMYYKDQLVPTGEFSNVGYPIMTNVNNSYRAGIEITAGYNPFKLISWQVSTTLSKNRIVNFTEYYTDYISSEDSYIYKSKSPGNVDIAYSPSIIASSNITLNLPENFKMHFISKYVGDQYFDNTMSTDRMIKGYFVNNLRIDYNPSIKGIKKIDLQLFVNNVFNRKYVNNGYGGTWYEDGKENTWAYYFPQAGINYLMRLTVAF